MGAAHDTSIVLSPEYALQNRMAKSFSELLNGPAIRPNIMDPTRRQYIQAAIDLLNKSFQDLETKDVQLLSTGQHYANAAVIFQSILSAKFRLKNLQKMLDDFELLPPKQDNFDRDLLTMRLKSEEINSNLLLLAPTHVQ